jgi:hypothetical protein
MVIKLLSVEAPQSKVTELTVFVAVKVPGTVGGVVSVTPE